jgi:hypothetical protein
MGACEPSSAIIALAIAARFPPKHHHFARAIFPSPGQLHPAAAFLDLRRSSQSVAAGVHSDAKTGERREYGFAGKIMLESVGMGPTGLRLAWMAICSRLVLINAELLLRWRV